MKTSRTNILRLQMLVTMVLYVLVVSVQVTAFIGHYYAWGAFVAVLLFGVVLLCVWWKSGLLAHDAIEAAGPRIQMFSRVCLVVAGIIFIVRIAFPLTIWPYSSLGVSIPYDAVSYHFPKAVELWKTGTIWDTGVTYWEYPSGYEGLLSLSLLITGKTIAFGFLHALIALQFALTLCGLMIRFTKLSAGILAMFVVMGLIYLPLSWTVFEVGKNDLMIAGAMLSLLLYAPITPGMGNGLGLALVSGLALSIKPTAIPLLVLVLAFTLFKSVKNTSPISAFGTGRSPTSAIGVLENLKIALVYGLFVLPGGLWVIRNYVIQGTLFSQQTMSQSGWTILNNLANSEFYHVISPRELWMLLGLSVAVAGVATALLTCRRSRKKDVGLSRISDKLDKTVAEKNSSQTKEGEPLVDTRIIGSILLLLFGCFLTTPCSALWNNNIQWRFAVGVFAFIVVSVVVLAEPLIHFLLTSVIKWQILTLIQACVIFVVGLAFLWQSREHYRWHTDHERTMSEWFACPVGKGGYSSAYDFVRRNLHGAVIATDTGLPFFLYGPEFDNAVLMGSLSHPARDRREPSVYVAFNGGTGSSIHPAGETGYRLIGLETNSNWKLIYEDTQSKVYSH